MSVFLKKNQIVVTLLLFFLSTGFFQFKYLVQGINYSHYYGFFNIFLLLCLGCDIIKKEPRCGIVATIRIIIIMFVVAMLWATFFHFQSPINSVQGMAADLPLISFFYFMKYKYENKKLTKSIFIAGILYAVIYVYCLFTFPNSIFAYVSNAEAIDKIMNSVNERGVVRLSLPGADIMVATFFAILTYFRSNKIWYLLLIPVIVMIILRGTRTPLFVSVFVGCGYLLYKVKYRWLAIVFLFIMVFGGVRFYNKIIEGKGTDPISIYIKMTQAQLKSNDKEGDIRLEMTKYFFTKYNDNPVEYLVGNGKPAGSSEYSKELIRLSETRSYYIVDVGFTYIFVYYGIVGLILYTWLFVCILRTPVEEKYMFSKLYVIYGYLLLPTNVSILWIAPFIFSLNLYIVYRSSLDLRKTIIDTNNKYLKQQ